MGIKCISDGPYFPVRGMNPDANGLLTRKDEASFILNCEVSSLGIRQRRGTTPLKPFHITLKNFPEHPDAEGEYSPGMGLIVGRQYYIFVDYKIWYNTSEDKWNITQSMSDGPGDLLLAKNDSQDLRPPETGWYLNTDTFTLVLSGYTYSQDQDDIIELHKYYHPVEGSIIFAFCEDKIYRYSEDWTSVNHEVKLTEVSCDTTFTGLNEWSITNIVDKKLGSTVVAAGCVHTPIGFPYTDGPSRVLLYYDLASGTFKELDLKVALPDELTYDDLISVPSSPTVQVFTTSDATVPIVSGTAYLVVEDVGVIAYASLTENGTKQLLLPVDYTQVAQNDNSYLDLATGEVSLEFLTTDFNGRKLHLYYEYTSIVTHKPVCISGYRNSLVIANLYEDSEYYPWLVRYTKQGDITMLRERDYQELVVEDVSPILTMRALETDASSTIIGPLYFFKANSIVRGTYNQSFNLKDNIPMFNFELAYSEGILGTRTLVNIMGKLVYLGRNDIYIFDGVNRVSLTRDNATGNSRVRNFMLANLDLMNLNYCFAYYDENAHLYVIHLKFMGDESRFPEYALVYNFELNQWTAYKYPPTSAGVVADIPASGTISQLSTRINALQGKIKDLSGVVDKYVLLSQPNTLFVVSEHETGIDKRSSYMPNETGDELEWAGSAFDSYVITKDFFANELQTDDRVERIHFEGKTGIAHWSYSNEYSISPEEFENEQDVQMGSKFKRYNYFIDRVAQHIRFNVTLTNGAKLRWLQVFSVQQEFTNE